MNIIMEYKKSENFTYLEIVLILLLFTFCFQNLNIIEFYNFGFKLYHLLSLLFLPALIKCEKIKLPPKFFMFYFYYIIVVSIISYFIYGFNSLFLNYIFGFYLLLVHINVFKNVTFEKWLKIIQTSATLCLIAVLIKDFIYRDIIISFLKNPYGHPVIVTFLGGGPNLEASWLALLGFSFYKNKKGLLYSILSIIISAIYSTRVGIISSLLLLIFILYQLFFSNGSKNINVMMIVFIGFVGLIIAYKLDIFNYIIKRFVAIGDDSGSLGRLAMWKYVFESFKRNPLGYGIGNAILSIELVSGVSFSESNVHNLFFQKILDTGFIGGILYLIILFLVFKNGIKKFFKNPFYAFFISYFILSFVQYRGGDSIFFFILGVYFSLKINGEGEKNDSVKKRFKRMVTV